MRHYRFALKTSTIDFFYLGIILYSQHVRTIFHGACTHHPYDQNILFYVDHLKRTNSLLMHNSHRFNPRHSESSHNKYIALPAPSSSFNTLNNIKLTTDINLQLRIQCTHSLIITSIYMQSLVLNTNVMKRKLKIVLLWESTPITTRLFSFNIWGFFKVLSIYKEL